MGYESKFYIVEQKTTHYINRETGNEEVDYWNNIISMYDLCKLGNFNYNLFNKKLEGQFVIGNSFIETDNYGEPLKYCDDLSALITEIENIMQNDNYRRFSPILAMLKDFEANKNRFDKLIVVHFGY